MSKNLTNKNNSSMKTLNIVFFALILLCSFATLENKLHKKKTRTTKNDITFPFFNKDLKKDSIKNSTFNMDKKLKNLPKQKRFEMEIEELDSKNSTLNVSQLNLTSEAAKCVEKFKLVLNDFPAQIQLEIVSEFQNYFTKKPMAENTTNFDANVCCLSNNLIKTASKKMNSITKNFAGLISKQESECKNGFACFRGNEVLIKALGKKLDSTYKNKNQANLKNLLKEGKIQNSNLIKCLVYMQKISVRNLGLICANDDLLSKTFLFNSENKILKAKKFPEDDFDFYSNCGEYVKNFNLYPEEITNAFVDSLNFLLGTEQCNYFSDFFAKNKDRKALNPKMFFGKFKENNKNVLDKSKNFVSGLFNKFSKNSSRGNATSDADKNRNESGFFNKTLGMDKSAALKMLKEQLPKGDSTKSLIEKWSNCASKAENFNMTIVQRIKNILPKKLAENPNGLLNGKLRGVNFKEIKHNFDSTSNPQFLITCEAAKCNLSLGSNSNLNNVNQNFNSSRVVSNSNVTLDYSCCDRICVVNYNLNFTGNESDLEAMNDENSNEENGFENNLLPLQFTEIKSRKTNNKKNQKQFFNKFLGAVGLGQNSTNITKNKKHNKLILSGAEIFEIKAINEYALKPNKKEEQKLKSALKNLINKPANVSFADENFIKEIKNFGENQTNYVNDARLKATLLLNVQLANGSLNTLADFLVEDLSARKNPLYLNCKSGKCALSEFGQETQTLNLAANTNLTTGKFLNEFNKHLDNDANKLLNSSKIGRLINDNKNITKNSNGFLHKFSNHISNRGTFDTAQNKTESQVNAFTNGFGSLSKKGSEHADKSKKHLGQFSKLVEDQINSKISKREFYYRPNYKDLEANFTLDSLDAQSVHNILAADVSRLAISGLPHFNKTLFLEDLNANFIQNFSLEFECAEYFCVLIAKSESNILVNNQPNAKPFLIQVHQRKPYAFDVEKLSLTQKKCIVKNILQNEKQPAEFFELSTSIKDFDLSSLNVTSDLNPLAISDGFNSAFNQTTKNKTNVIEVCNIETPYSELPISTDCLSSLVGHCQKSNFFDLYNRYTKGVASYEDLPAASAAQNSCVSPLECANLNEESTKERKEKCGAAIANLLFANGNRFSYSKLITPCKGNLPAASVEPIAFVAIGKNTKSRKMKNKKLNKVQSQITQESNSQVIDYSKLSDEEKKQLSESKLSAESNTDATVTIDGVTKDPSSVNVDADLAIINKNVEEDQKNLQVQIAGEASTNSGDNLKFAFYTFAMIIFALLF